MKKKKNYFYLVHWMKSVCRNKSAILSVEKFAKMYEKLVTRLRKEFLEEYPEIRFLPRYHIDKCVIEFLKTKKKFDIHSKKQKVS